MMAHSPFYYTCPTCGANLDPGETCTDCYPNQTDNDPVDQFQSDNPEMDENVADVNQPCHNYKMVVDLSTITGSKK